MERPLDALLSDYDAEASLAEASTIPSSWYTDGRVAELERRRVFSTSWQLVGRVAEVARPGDYLTAEVAGEPVLVVRGSDGALRGFFNVCRHHAAAVMTERCGHAEKLTCPYHGWTYGLDGKLKSAPEMQDIDFGAYGLVPLAVATWQELVFVRLEGEGGLDFGALAARLGDVSRLQFAGRREWILDCNWKVFVDNYLDGGYHVPYLHRGLGSVLSHKDYAIEVGGRACLQSSPVTTGRGAEASTAAVRKGMALYLWLYPNLMLNAYDGYLDTNLVVPLGIDRTRVVFDFYFEDASDPACEESIAVSARIQEEDLAICASVQRGLSSRAYGAGRLSVRREAGEHLFHRLLAGDLRR